MDYKEKMLEAYGKYLATDKPGTFIEFVGTLPSEKEIAKGLILDCCKVLDAYPDSVTVDVVLIMLDKEEKDG